MFCAKCKRHVAYCKCNDINDRLSDIGKLNATKDLALGAMEQRVEEKLNKHLQDIEFMYNNDDKRLKIHFRSKRHDGIYYITGKVVDITPDYIHIIESETDYPGQKFDLLNTSRITGVEVANE